MFSTHLDTLAINLGLPNIVIYGNTILITTTIYILIFIFTKHFSKYFIAYNNLDDHRKLNWCIRACSQVNSYICVLGSLVFLFGNEQLDNDNVTGNDYNSFIFYSVATGYFLWDILIVTLNNIRVFTITKVYLI
jgi:hypothetical protein